MNKIKQIITTAIESEKGKDILVVLIVVLVGISSFYLGRLSKASSNGGIKIEYNGQKANVLGSMSQNEPQIGQILLNPSTSQNTQKNTKGEYFASSRGKKYYSINCSAGKTIKIENRIYFATSGAAEVAGYTLSSACK